MIPRPTCEVCAKRLATVFFATFHATPMAVCNGCIGVCRAKVEFEGPPVYRLDDRREPSKDEPPAINS